MDAQELENFIKKRADETWAAGQEPYFLANVQPELQKLNKDYRSALDDGLKLSQFAESLASIKFLRHSTKPSIVAAIPLGQDYDIEAHGSVSAPARSRARANPKSNERVVLDFLKLLGELDDPQVDDVVLPARVLAKMINR